MSLPTDFSREIAERAPQPGFDAVVDRAHTGRRRRRTTIASGLAAAVVVAAVSWAAGVPATSDHRSPEPAPPGLVQDWDGTSEVDPSLPGAVQSLLREGQPEVYDVAAFGDQVAVVWNACPSDQPCRFVLTIRDGDDVVGRTLDGALPALTPTSSGLVLDDVFVNRLSPTGELEPLHDTRPGNAGVMSGDTYLSGTSFGAALLRGTKLVEVPLPAGVGGSHNGYVAPDGRIVLVDLGPDGGMSLVASDDGRTWEEPVATSSTGLRGVAQVAGSGDHVTVAVLGDYPDPDRTEPVPVRQVLVSHDAGATWSEPAGLDLDGAEGLHDLSSLVVAPSGSTYLTTSDGLVRIGPDGNATPMPLSPRDSAAFVVGDAVCVVVAGDRADELQCSDDDGTTWAPQPLPGFG